jgi:hypothetical protein
MLKKVDMIIRNKVSFRPGKNDFLYVKNYENVFSYVQNSNSFKVQRKDGINLIELPHSFAIFNLMPSGNGILNRSQLKNIVGKNSIEVNEKEKKLLGQIEEPFEEYNLLFKKCKVFNGMSFELNTPFIWDNRKYRLFNLLDYARKTKHIILTKKRQLKVSQLINHYNS